MLNVGGPSGGGSGLYAPASNFAAIEATKRGNRSERIASDLAAKGSRVLAGPIEDEKLLSDVYRTKELGADFRSRDITIASPGDGKNKMSAQRVNEEEVLGPQRFRNGEIHDWYRTVWGYSDHLVSGLIDELVTTKARVLDPFCGSGTTLVECMKHGIASAGVDANPVSCFVARTKTTWHLQPDRLLELLDEVADAYSALKDLRGKADKTFEYLLQSGMLERGWISIGPLQRALAIKRSIRELRTSARYKNALMIALLDTFVRCASNVKFGPELYCAEPRRYVRILEEFARRVRAIASDLSIAHDTGVTEKRACVVLGDARDCAVISDELGQPHFTHVICSPPYPAEHDYTRNSRLELALLESVNDNEALRAIKRTMVRSHTKGIYNGDVDALYAKGLVELDEITRQIDRRAAEKTHGFAKLYSRVTMEYFGGMARHLTNLHAILAKRAVLAYVVGDQSSYLQVPIPTARILGQLAQRCGYELLEIRHWRTRSTTSSHGTIKENVLILRRAQGERRYLATGPRLA